jgi:membrane protease YdiL (CAAX protease family)
MRIFVPVVFLALIFALLSRRLQDVLRGALSERPALVFAVPAALSILFCGIAAAVGALNPPLAALIVTYTLAPTVLAWLARRTKAPSWIDFGVILLLWLPLEFSLGERWVPKPQQGLLHTAAYGVSVTLGLVLFLLFRRLEGMKYNLPRTARDFLNPLIGFACVVPILWPLGRALEFLQPFHVPAQLSAVRLAGQFLVILAATALPEEILFRAMIQNSLMQKLGENTGVLLLAAVIFGAAHLDNGPGPLPNWRYMVLATIAGAVYGRVYQRSASIFASAFLHALVNTIKHSFF